MNFLNKNDILYSAIKKNLHILLYGVALVICYGCSRDYENTSTRLLVSSKLLDCEENNVHLLVVESEENRNIGTSILPVCADDPKCEVLFYALEPKDSTQTFVIEGCFSVEEHGQISYGCVDSKAFKIRNYK